MQDRQAPTKCSTHPKRRNLWWCFCFLILFCGAPIVAVFSEPFFHLTDEEALRIGIKIWYNEGAGNRPRLTWWNAHENFASLGIGHFIWYPATDHKTYKETFPQFLKFIEARGITVPTWLEGDTVPPCLWPQVIDFQNS